MTYRDRQRERDTDRYITTSFEVRLLFRPDAVIMNLIRAQICERGRRGERGREERERERERDRERHREKHCETEGEINRDMQTD